MGGQSSVAVGDVFGGRTVIEKLRRRNRQLRVRVRCECGAVDDVYLADLRAGRCDHCTSCRANSAGARVRRGVITVRCPGCEHVFNVDKKGNPR